MTMSQCNYIARRLYTYTHTHTHEYHYRETYTNRTSGYLAILRSWEDFDRMNTYTTQSLTKSIYQVTCSGCESSLKSHVSHSERVAQHTVRYRCCCCCHGYKMSLTVELVSLHKRRWLWLHTLSNHLWEDDETMNKNWDSCLVEYHMYPKCWLCCASTNTT